MMVDEIKKFETECREEVKIIGKDEKLQKLTSAWLARANDLKYSYHFKALGRPIIQYPQDMIALHEIIWTTKPTLIIETGIAHGGSLVWSAANLALLDLTENRAGAFPRRVVGIDIDIREHNRIEIQNHPISSRIKMIEGSSVEPEILAKVKAEIRGTDKVMVVLDSNHTHDHVLNELRNYSNYVSPDCYLIVMDTVVERLKHAQWPGRDWGVGNNPMTAVREFLKDNEEFEIDKDIESKIAISVAYSGYLRRK